MTALMVEMRTSERRTDERIEWRTEGRIEWRIEGRIEGMTEGMIDGQTDGQMRDVTPPRPGRKRLSQPLLSYHEIAKLNDSRLLRRRGRDLP